MKTISITAVAALLTATSAVAMDLDRYRTIVGETIKGTESESVDVAHLIDLQEQLVSMGVQGAREYGVEAPEQAQLMNFVADHAGDMATMSLDEIEAAWHEGEALQEIGVSIDDLDHFGRAVSHIDAIVHPSTAIIALRDYGESGDRVHLLQVRDELSEVVEHLGHIN